MKKLILATLSILMAFPANAASVVASVNGTPITDADVTARVALMNKQGKTSTDNRRVALQNIIDDSVKLAYAQNFNAVPDDETVNTELKKMNLGELSATERAMAQSALRAEIAWQIIVARTILPTVDITDAEIANERAAIARDQGLPIEMTLIRLVDIPADVAAKLTKPTSCDDAMQMARNMNWRPIFVNGWQHCHGLPGHRWWTDLYSWYATQKKPKNMVNWMTLLNKTPLLNRQCLSPINN